MGWRALAVAATAAAFLLAAKAHGRQLRLERELAGFFEVSFARPNAAWVEAFWRQQRLEYWLLAALLALGSIAYAALAPRFGWPRPGLLATRLGAGLVIVAWPLVAAFALTGLASLLRFAASGSGRAWFGSALWGSGGWWLATVLCAIAAGYATLRPLAIR